MFRHEKVIGSLLIVHALHGVWWVYEAHARVASPALFATLNVILAAIGLSAGIGYFKAYASARVLGQLFYGVQVPQLLLGPFIWSFTLGLQLVFSFGWINFGQIGVNILALAMLIWISSHSGVAARKLAKAKAAA
jgi:hypothetical protein